MTQPNVAWQRAKHGYSLSDKHGHASYYETVNEPCAQKSLNRDSAVDIKVMGSAGGQLRNDLGRRAVHVFNDRSNRLGQIDRAAAQDHDALITIWPRVKGKN